MKLSVVIVNYNVKAFLEQCLRSVYEALLGMEGEVFVVDNQSTDGSVEMVRRKFPEVHVVANQVNVGFSRANNQAIRMCRGEYVLLLNPDTVVGEDVFQKVVAFMDANPRTGGLGVKMVDGTGRFLPESKRGLPTPTVAFFKIIGLSRLFPHSKVFGRYHLGHLPENETAPIEILSGACMFLRRSVLEQVGLLDESFFMYGEDIDLSYRIRLGGYENWYFPEARIIHYKGESTKKSSVNYVFVFYNAMVIFARKHFARRGPQLFSYIIQAAIYLSAAAAIVTRFLRGALLPLLDIAVIYGGLYLLTGHIVSPAPGPMDKALVTGISLACLGAFGAYDIPWRPGLVALGMAVSLLVLFAVAPWAGPGWATVLPLVALLGVVLVIMRLVPSWLGMKRGPVSSEGTARVLAVGTTEEAKLALDLLWQTHYGLGHMLQLDAKELDAPEGIATLRGMVRKERVHEVVFCAKDLRMQQTIEVLESMRNSKVVFKIAQPGSTFIIGPGATESLQDLLVLRDHAVNSPAAVRRRRSLDVLLALFFLVTLPGCIWFVRDKGGFLRNIHEAIMGRITWVGYAAPGRDRRLPRLRPAVLPPALADGLLDKAPLLVRVDLEYAKDYRVWRDCRRVLARMGQLGARPARA
ncbi:MAG TPA: glycosyltransferase family 2 protein [Flavobacteriales bacterium]|nr:glycosyltransferase family 2 protein [Flavobacteriales bacterium]